MLNTDDVAEALVEALRGIRGLVAAMGDDAERIMRYTDELGGEPRVMKAIQNLRAPGILVVVEGIQGGNFDGATIAKHALSLYARPANVANVQNAVSSLAGLWDLICNGQVQGAGKNVRAYSLMAELELMDTPSWVRGVDETGGADFLWGRFLIPEIGDN